MKTLVRSAAFVAGLVCIGAANAQSTPTKVTPAPATARTATVQATQAPAKWTPLNVEHMMTALALTEEQTSKLKQIDASYNKLHATMQTGMTEADLMLKRDAEVKGVLTPEQHAKWTREQAATMRAPQTKPATTPVAPAQPATPAPKPQSK